VKHRIELDYRRERAAAYPPLADLADALVKQDDAALTRYRDQCLAVKARFPKPKEQTR
jgi:hypothetical protein